MHLKNILEVSERSEEEMTTQTFECLVIMTTPFESSGLFHVSLEIPEGGKIRGRPGLMLAMTLYQREKEMTFEIMKRSLISYEFMLWLNFMLGLNFTFLCLWVC